MSVVRGSVVQVSDVRKQGSGVRKALSDKSDKEFRRFVFMAIGSADEMRIWCRYALDLNYITPTQWKSWRNEYRQIAKMLQAFAKSSPDP